MELKGKSSRIQSSLGSKLVESNDSVISTLLIARVTDINYKENYVIFVPITTNSTSRPSTRGTNQALLPSEFAGRNGFGRSYGVINPIHVGDIVLIGLLESDAAKPIVISRYPDTKIASELTDQASEHYEPADFSNYATANKRIIVYPDQGYNIHDGRGNLTLKFSGNTFMLVRPDVPIVSHATDDGDTPINAQNIPGNSDGSGQPRNAMVQNAPEVIYGHRGNINKDGTKDNHAYYVYIGQDGDYRVSMMQDDQDWRTYFEETPDGQIRLRRQEDSKIFGTGSKSSEFLIDNNGYVTIRSQSTGLVLKPDGIYNLDGTKFTVDTDLSGVWDAITETQNGVKENKAQITVNANEISTKVSTDELPAAINDQLKPYDASLKNLQDSYTDVQKAIDNLASDGIISGADKKATRTIWLQIQTEYPATVAQAEANGVDHSSLDTSYNTLSAYLEPILSAGGDTTVDPTEWDRNFSNYYNASFNVNTAIVAALRKLAQSGYDKAVQAGLDAGSAITQASEASSEDYLTGSDKATLNHIWVQIQNQYPNDVASANAVSVDHSALDSAYNDLSSYISSNNVFADSSTIAIDGSALADKIKAYFSQEATVLKQVADKNIQTLAQYGEDINHQATSIKETSDKIALSAENIQKHGDSLAVMQGQLGVMANQISGGVSETDVTGIVNDSLSGTDLGSTNQFILITATKGQYLNGNNGTSSSSANGIITDYISVNAGSNYTAKVYGATGTTKLSIAWYDTNKNFISGTEVSGTGNFTNAGASPSNSAYSRVSTDNYNVNTLFMTGNAPDAWVPSYEDAKIDANDANEFLKSLADLQASLASLINANGNKKTYNIANIDSMFASGNIGSNDIGILKAVLSDITQDNASDNSLATQYSVDISALNDYFNQLKTDINGMLSQDEGTPVDIDSYKAKLSGYYTSRDTFLKAVKGKIDTQVADAKSALDAAKNTVQEVVTNKYANFAVTVDGISTKVGEVSEKADNASAAASTAQSYADDAKNRAISAASAAATAQAGADTANSAASAAASAASAAQTIAGTTQESLDALTNDGNISPIEKQTLSKEFATIKTNKTIDLAQASKYSVDATAYTNAEQAVETMVNPILNDMTTNTAVDRDKYKSTFATYYNERTNLLNAIADVAKNAASAAASAASAAQGTANSAASAASAAQSDLNSFKTTTTQKFSEIDQTADGIKQSVTAVATTANNASDKINNLQVGGTNLILGTTNKVVTIDATAPNANTNYTFNSSLYTTLDSSKTYAFSADVAIIKGSPTQISVGSFNGNDASTIDAPINNNHIVAIFTPQSSGYTNLIIYAGVRGNTAGNTINFSKIKLEVGNTATAWSPAPADNASASDLNDFKTTTTQKFSEIDQTADGIKQSVTAVTTTANNASNAINNLQVGGTNLLTGTSNQLASTSLSGWGEHVFGNVVPQAGTSYCFKVWIDNPTFDACAKLDCSDSSGSQIVWAQGNTISAGTSGYSIVKVTTDSKYANIKCQTVYTFNHGASSSGSYGYKEAKLEVGNMPTAWSPAPADNASASDLATTNQTVKTVQTQTANNWSIFAQGIGGTSAGISVDGNGTVTISGNKLVIGSDFIAGNITGKTITGSAFVNTFSHAQIDGAKSSGTLSISNAQIAINGNIEDNNGNSNGQTYNTNVGPNGTLNYITTPDGKGNMSMVALQNGALQLQSLISDPAAATKQYIRSQYTSKDNVTYYYNNTTAYSNDQIAYAYIRYARRGNIVTVNFQLAAGTKQYPYERLADIRPGYKPYSDTGIACMSMSYPGESVAIYASTPSGGTKGWYTIISAMRGNFNGTASYLTMDDYPTGDSFFG